MVNKIIKISIDDYQQNLHPNSRFLNMLIKRGAKGVLRLNVNTSERYPDLFGLVTIKARRGYSITIEFDKNINYWIYTEAKQND